jgi:hypothetical protein
MKPAADSNENKSFRFDCCFQQPFRSVATLRSPAKTFALKTSVKINAEGAKVHTKVAEKMLLTT